MPKSFAVLDSIKIFTPKVERKPAETIISLFVLAGRLHIIGLAPRFMLAALRVADTQYYIAKMPLAVLYNTVDTCDSRRAGFRRTITGAHHFGNRHLRDALDQQFRYAHALRHHPGFLWRAKLQQERKGLVRRRKGDQSAGKQCHVFGFNVVHFLFLAFYARFVACFPEAPGPAMHQGRVRRKKKEKRRV